MFLACAAGLELALAWTNGVGAFALPNGVAELLAGMVASVAAFALFAYGCKLARRPAVLMDELAILPGRAGVGGAVLTLYLLATLIVGVAGGVAAWALLVLGLILHAAAVSGLGISLRHGPPERRMISPDWQLILAGLAVAARAAMVLGWPALAAWMAVSAGLAAVAIWALSLRQLFSSPVPAPLRPLLALHLWPVGVLSTVALGLGEGAVGTALAWAALAGTLAMGAGARWMLADGLSPFWGAPAFAVAATAGAWVVLWTAEPTELHRMVAGVLLVAATLTTVPVLGLVLRDWTRGQLQVRSNAAIA